MKILALTNIYPPHVLGGYEQGLQELVEGLRGRGHEVTVLAGRGPNDIGLRQDGVHRAFRLADIYGAESMGEDLRRSELFRGRVVDLFNVAALLDALTAQSYDVVFAGNLLGLGAMALVDALTASGVPWAWYLADSVPAQMLEGVAPEIAGLFRIGATRRVEATAVLVKSWRLAREIEAAGVSLGSPPVAVRWGMTSRAPRPERKGDRVRFVFAGTLSEEKGVPIVLAALAGLPADAQARVSVDFFGRGDTRRYRNEAARLGIEQQVTFHGQTAHDAFLGALGGFDAMLFPTWEREPFGRVAVEAALQGVPVILTRGTGAAEVLEHGRHAIHIERSPAAVKAAILQILSEPDRFAQLGRQAEEHAAASLTLDHALDVVEGALLEIASPFPLTSGAAQRLCDAARFKYDQAKQHVAARGVTSIAPSTPLSESFADFKQVGRAASRNPALRLLRSGLMKLLRPYLVELLARDAAQQQRLAELSIRLAEREARNPAS